MSESIKDEEFYVDGVCIGCNYTLYPPGYCANVRCPLRDGDFLTSNEHVKRLARMVADLRRQLSKKSP